MGTVKAHLVKCIASEYDINDGIRRELTAVVMLDIAADFWLVGSSNKTAINNWSTREEKKMVKLGSHMKGDRCGRLAKWHRV